MHKRQDFRQSPALHACLQYFVPMVLLCLSACQPADLLTATKTRSPINSITPTEHPQIFSPTGPAAIKTLIPTATPTPDCLVYGGDLQFGTFYSELLGADFNFQIYLPPCYQTHSDQRFPVVYLLHGLSSTNEQWLNLGLIETMDKLIANRDIAPFIIVLPQETVFAPPQTSQFGNAIVSDLIPWIDSHYRTMPEKTFRGIGGLSRGAAWAVHIGFTNYELFSSVGAHSLPLFQADGANINTWITQLPKEELPLFFFDIGRGDRERLSAQDFADQLDQNNIPHEWYLFIGGHTEAYWSNHLDQYLRWYARLWTTEIINNDVK